jgi:hypothetical protein
VRDSSLLKEPDIGKVQESLWDTSASITRIYDRRKTRPKDIPTFHVKY